MLKKIASGYGRLFSSLAKIIALAAICLGFSALFVYPLWKWAISSSSTYSWTILGLTVAFIIYALIRKSIKLGIIAFLKKLAKVLTVIGGLCGCFVSVLQGKRVAALIIFIAAFIVYGILAFGLREKSHQDVIAE